jgi:hypothetical protein
MFIHRLMLDRCGVVVMFHFVLNNFLLLMV